ncbi:ligand-gated channel [Acetobacter syzygii]|nr:Fe3+ siderophore receptor [Acetobacter syzygii]GBR62120.1 TonB-dependent receptor [Acetobacter syzygii NRIC 0483]GEL56006.1 ligand-gated channel [Acetobacter syzygii]
MHQILGRRFKKLSVGWYALGGLLCASTAIMPVCAQTPSVSGGEVHTFTIAPQPLATALRQFSRQSGIQVSVPTSLAHNLVSPGVSGHLSAQDALGKMLAGTGLSFRSTAPTSVALVQGAATPQGVAATAQGEKVDVVGRARTASTMASSGTKTNTPLVNTAQSITVISRHEMDNRGVLSLNQAIRYMAGVLPDQRGATATRYDLFTLRGFTVPTFLDGLKEQSSPNGYATAQTDTSRLDRIEVLKGPSSALYGQSSPGGLVALSSKLPTEDKFYGGLTATGGSFDLYRVDGDVGGWATKDGFVRYRLYGTVNGSHSQLSQTVNRRYSISPAITIGGDGPTTLTLLGNYQYDPKNASYGSVPLVGSLKKADFGYIKQNFYDGDRSYEEFDRNHGSITYIFKHDFNKDWSVASRGRYDDVRTKYKSVYGYGIYQDASYNRDMAMEQLGNFSRGVGFANERMQNLAFDSQVKGRFDTSILHHQLMVGFDYQQSHATELDGWGSAPSINVLHPVYGQKITAPAASSNYITNQHQVGLYAQDQIRIQNLYLTGSLRNDWYRSEQTERMSNSVTHQNPEQITFRASGLYHFNFGLSPYISYATSFAPQAGVVSSDGVHMRQADPSMGKQLEGGFKYQIPSLPVLLSAAGFHIEQTGVLVAVPNSSYSTQSGKVHSDGFEFEAHVEAYKGLDVTAAISTQRVHDDSTGHPLIGANRGNASLFAFYTMQSGRLKGFGFGGGVRHVASSYGGTASYGSVTVPSYTLFDGSISYDMANLGHSFKGWKLQASVRNLFNKRYVASCYGYAPYDEWCWYGERRNAQASIGYSW